MFKVEKELCIGCGACVSIASDVFVFDQDGLAIVKEEVSEELKDIGMQALESCPTEAIKYIEKE